MHNPLKDLVLLFWGILALVAVFFFFPAVSFPQTNTVIETTRSSCPSVPSGCLSPRDVVNWTLSSVPIDSSLVLVLMNNPTGATTVEFATGIFIVGTSWPVLFNYLENGVLTFLRFDPSFQQYVRDETVDDESYQIVVAIYRRYFNVFISTRKNV